MQETDDTYPKNKLDGIEEWHPELREKVEAIVAIMQYIRLTSTGTNFWAIVMDSGDTTHEI